MKIPSKSHWNLATSHSNLPQKKATVLLRHGAVRSQRQCSQHATEAVAAVAATVIGLANEVGERTKGPHIGG